MLKILALIFPVLFIALQSQLIAFKALPSGYFELKHPGESFVSPVEYHLVTGRQLPGKNRGLAWFAEFHEALYELKFEKAEQVLLENKQKPVSALNLVFFYIYLDNEDAARLSFSAWQNFNGVEPALNLVELLGHKEMKKALRFLSSNSQHEPVRFFSLYNLARVSDNPAVLKLVLRTWLARENPFYQRALLELSLKADTSSLQEKDFDVIENKSLGAVIRAQYYQNKNELLTSLRLYSELVHDKSGSRRVSRDVYTRLVRLMFSLKKYHELENYLDNPPIFLQPAVPKLQAIVQKQKNKNQFQSNVVTIKIEEEIIENDALEAERAAEEERKNAELKKQTDPDF